MLPSRQVTDLYRHAGSGDALTTAQVATEYLTAFLIAALCLAVLVAAFVQLLAPWINAAGQRFGVNRWLRRMARRVTLSGDRDPERWRREAEDSPYRARWLWQAVEELGTPLSDALATADQLMCSALDRIGHAVGRSTPWLPMSAARLRDAGIGQRLRTGSSDEQFMHVVQAEVRAAVARPSAAPSMFLLSTAGCSLDQDAMPLLAVDLLAGTRPDAAMRLAGTPGGEHPPTEGGSPLAAAAAAVTAIDDAVGRQVEVNLDELQRDLLNLNAVSVRGTSLALGLGAALIGRELLHLPSGITTWGIGLTGGVLAILLRDVLGAVATRRAG